MKNIFRTVLLMAALALLQSAKAQVPVLNSYPSAQATIFLDFDGQTISGTSWNMAGDFACGASGLSSADITTVFNRVSEDYRPFNINITTDSTKYFAAPINKRMRIVLTVTSSWYGNAGGVSYVNSFTWGDNTPGFVFTALLNYNVKNISEAAAHEAGHTLGLFHQSTYNASCVKTSEYNYGTGSGEIGWAPIMGAGYYQNLTLWNNGPNPYGCSNTQSDLDIITTNNGFTYRPDDYVATMNGSTTSATFVNNQFTLNGIIERNTDQDAFKVVIPSGSNHFVLNAVPYNVGTGDAGSNLDLQVSLYNSGGSLIKIYNPGNLLSSVIDTNLNNGTYYILVEGKGNIYAPNYASLGSYSLQGSISSASLPVRSIVLTGALVTDKHQLNWAIDADEQVVSQVLEVSTDGRNFSTVTDPAPAARSFVYRPYVTTAAQYRLNVTFDNGRSYYSNIVTLRNTNTVDRPKLVSTLVYTNVVTVTSPGRYQYDISDMNGHTVSRGQLTNGLNNINIPVMSAGLYLVRFSDGESQWTDKLLRQ